jgi:hypothetical protein
LATLSRSHAIAAGVLPAVSTLDNVHGREVAHLWSADELAWTLRMTRPDGVAVDILVPAAPNHVFELALDPDEVVGVQFGNAGATNINVLVI